MRKCDRVRNRIWDLLIIRGTLCHKSYLGTITRLTHSRTIGVGISSHSACSRQNEREILKPLKHHWIKRENSSLLHAEWDDIPTLIARECFSRGIVPRWIRWQNIPLVIERFQVRFLTWSYFRIVDLHYSTFYSIFSYANYCRRNIIKFTIVLNKG